MQVLILVVVALMTVSALVWLGVKWLLQRFRRAPVVPTNRVDIEFQIDNESLEGRGSR